MFDRRLIRNFGWALFLMTLAFCAISLLNLYSASYETGLVYFKKQFIWVGIGVLTLVLVSFVNYRFLKQYSIYIYGVSILLLLFVLFFGKEVAGSKSWINIASVVSIQPSELAKIAVIIILARFYDNDYQATPYGFLDLIKPFILIAIPASLILLQPDLGTAAWVYLWE